MIIEVKPASLIPPIVSPFGNRDERKLTTIYKQEAINYEVHCFSSFCRERCHFSNDILGEVVFDRKEETFISATKGITEDYIHCLRRTIKAWKRMFPEF